MPELFRGLTLSGVWDDASYPVKLLALMIAMIGGVVVLSAISRILSRGVRMGMLRFLGGLSLMLGLLSALIALGMAYEGMDIRQIATWPLQAAPMAEACLALGLGVAIRLVAAIGNIGARRA